ncbi:hypothetical protein SGLAM104S_09159 [Streptomyces glaucescens]
MRSASHGDGGHAAGAALVRNSSSSPGVVVGSSGPGAEFGGRVSLTSCQRRSSDITSEKDGSSSLPAQWWLIWPPPHTRRRPGDSCRRTNSSANSSTPRPPLTPSSASRASSDPRQPPARTRPGGSRLGRPRQRRPAGRRRARQRRPGDPRDRRTPPGAAGARAVTPGSSGPPRTAARPRRFLGASERRPGWRPRSEVTEQDLVVRRLPQGCRRIPGAERALLRETCCRTLVVTGVSANVGATQHGLRRRQPRLHRRGADGRHRRGALRLHPSDDPQHPRVGRHGHDHGRGARLPEAPASGELDATVCLGGQRLGRGAPLDAAVGDGELAAVAGTGQHPPWSSGSPGACRWSRTPCSRRPSAARRPPSGR